MQCLGGNRRCGSVVRPHLDQHKKMKHTSVPSSAIKQIDVGESKSGQGGVGSAAVHVECATTVVYEGYLQRKGAGRHYLEKKLEKALVCFAERFEAVLLRYRRRETLEGHD